MNLLSSPAADHVNKWTETVWDKIGTNIPSSTPSSLPAGTPSDIPSLRPSSSRPSSRPSSSPSDVSAAVENLDVVTSVLLGDDPVTNFNEVLDKIDTNITVPSNLNIMMVGDSVTRYQYLSLVHFLQFGKWVDPTSVPNMVWEKTHPSWNDFYNYTNSLLEPFEQCDCFRNSASANVIFENRYFLQPSRNNSVSYIQKFDARFPFKSQWNVTDIHKQHELVRNQTDLRFDVYRESKWTEFIRNFGANMNPKPGKMRIVM